MQIETRLATISFVRKPLPKKTKKLLIVANLVRQNCIVLVLNVIRIRDLDLHISYTTGLFIL